MTPHDQSRETIRRYAEEGLRHLASALEMGRNPLATDSRICSIVGSRGGGKTSVLIELASTAGGQYLALPIIEPEIFTQSDTLIGQMLASLLRKLRDDESGILDQKIFIPALDTEATIGVVIERLLRASVVMHPRVTMPNDSLEQQRSDFARQSILKESFPEALRQLVTLLPDTLMSRGDGANHLLLMVDDPDLRADLLPMLLQELRILATIPGMLVVVCFTPDVMREALAHSLRTTTSSDESSLKRSAELHMVKVFPTHLRVSLEPLSPAQRAEFRPEANLPSLKGLLTELRVPRAVPHGARNLWRILVPDPREDAITRDFLSALPENPRELTDLYRSLAHLADDAGRSTLEKYCEACKRILDASVGASRRDPLPPNAPDTIQVMATRPGQYELHVRLDDLDITTQTAMLLSLTLASGTIIETGTFNSLNAAGTTSKVRYDAGFASALALAKEMREASQGWNATSTGTGFGFGGSGKNLFRMQISGSRSDDEFISLPEWPYSDVFLIDTSWRRFSAKLRRLTTDLWPDPDAAALVIFAGYIAIVTARFQGRAVDFSLGRLEEALFEVDRGRQYVRDALDHLASTCARIPRGDLVDNRASGLLNWVSSQLPLFLHPALIDLELARHVMGVREEILKGRGFTGRPLMQRLDRRVRRARGEEWLNGIFTFARAGILPVGDLDALEELHHAALRAKGHGATVTGLERSQEKPGDDSVQPSGMAQVPSIERQGAEAANVSRGEDQVVAMPSMEPFAARDPSKVHMILQRLIIAEREK